MDEHVCPRTVRPHIILTYFHKPTPLHGAFTSPLAVPPPKAISRFMQSDGPEWKSRRGRVAAERRASRRGPRSSYNAALQIALRERFENKPPGRDRYREIELAEFGDRAR